jgi:hypothetical protein
MVFSGLRTQCSAHPTAQGLSGLARAWVWALVALFVLATLAPAISRTLDHGRPLAERGWLEVCSARGMAWVQADGAGQPDGSAPPSDLPHHMDSCGYCVLATDRGTPPPSFDGWGLSLSVASVCASWGEHSPPTAPVQLALARGPPTST